MGISCRFHGDVGFICILWNRFLSRWCWISIFLVWTLLRLFQKWFLLLWPILKLQKIYISKCVMLLPFGPGFSGFFSGSWPLPLKLSLKSHQMKTFFIQNEDWEKNDIIFLKTLSFLTKKKLSFNDFLMTTWEQEKKKNPKIRAYETFGNVYPLVLTENNRWPLLEGVEIGKQFPFVNGYFLPFQFFP